MATIVATLVKPTPPHTAPRPPTSENAPRGSLGNKRVSGSVADEMTLTSAADHGAPCFYKHGVRGLANWFAIVQHGNVKGKRTAFGGAGVPGGKGVTR
jgi:hypothetical protein